MTSGNQELSEWHIISINIWKRGRELGKERGNANERDKKGKEREIDRDRIKEGEKRERNRKR